MIDKELMVALNIDWDIDWDLGIYTFKPHK